MTWRELAACRDLPWFSPRMSDEMRRAKCEGCPVRLKCRAEARALNEPAGMWGGETEAERLGSGYVPRSTIPRPCVQCGVLFSPTPRAGTVAKACCEEHAEEYRRTRQLQFARSNHVGSTRLGCPLCGDTSKTTDGVCQGWECVRIRKIESRRSVAS